MKRFLLGWVGVAVVAFGARAEEPEFSSTLQGITLRPEIGTGSYGYEMSGNLGVTSLSTRSMEGRKYLLQWAADGEILLGIVAYEHPFYGVYGVQLAGQGDAGLRFMPASDFSPYFGVGLRATAFGITQSGVNLGGGNYSNNLDGLAGLAGTIQLRVDGGGSLLSSDHSLVIAAHLLAEGDTALSNVPALLFMGGGAHARYDLSNSLVAMGEFSYSSTLSYTDPALGLSTRKGRWLLGASVIKKLAGHVMLGLGISVSRTETDASYAGGLTYRSDTPVESRIWILGGFAP